MTDRPVTTSFTEADRLQARQLLDEVMFGNHSNDSADAVIAQALCEARSHGWDLGYADARESVRSTCARSGGCI